MRLKAVYNSKFGQWRLCHDQLCKPGETSIVATILTTENPAKDTEWAKTLADNFNLAQELKEKAGADQTV